MSSPPFTRWPVGLTWVLAGVILFAFAASAGFGAAYIMTSANAVPTVDPGLLPTPTSAPTPTPAPATATPSSSATPTATPSPSPEPPTATAQGSPSPSGEPTPTPTPISYVVKLGDRLGDIADQFGVSVDAIVELNHLKNPDHIEVGQILLIPVP